ncbi:hypothetical protein [Delftia sp. CH05]|uniref:hypothetical protein n=1 Tax=Delftia sp. CH05 TaxID=2692194 RepID=UPI00135D8753|nr:hypothetical protein [Delftia sp. CH05]MXN31496.1 hypothetical protein [Delftia sp. CH05]
MDLFSNNAETALASALTSDSGDPGYGTIVTTGAGLDGFANPSGTRSLRATITDATMPGQWEVVTIRQIDGVNLIVDRGVELPWDASGPMDWPAGAKVSVRVTAGMLETFVQMQPNGFFGPALSGADRFAALGYPALKKAWPQPLASASSFHRAGNGMSIVGGSMFVDLGTPPAWAAGNILHGDVVLPATPDGCQYWACTNQDSPVYADAAPDFQGAGTHVPLNPDNLALGYWVPVPMPVSLLVRLQGVRIVVEEVGFIASVVTASSPPTVSIGTDLDSSDPRPTRFANAVGLSQITGGGESHRIPIAVGGQLSNALTFRVDTLAAGGQFAGRFYWRGFYVEG